MDFAKTIRTIPDYPKKGIMFRDITTLLGNARAFRAAVDQLVQPYAGLRIDKIAGIEARGFILRRQGDGLRLRHRSAGPRRRRQDPRPWQGGDDAGELRGGLTYLDPPSRGEQVIENIHENRRPPLPHHLAEG
jgi:hypothetical protein